MINRYILAIIFLTPYSLSAMDGYSNNNNNNNNNHNYPSFRNIEFQQQLRALDAEPSAPPFLDDESDSASTPRSSQTSHQAMDPADPNTWLSTWVYYPNQALNTNPAINNANESRASRLRRLVRNIEAIIEDAGDDDAVSVQSPHPLSCNLGYRHTMICMEVMLKAKKTHASFYSQHLSWAVAQDGSIVPTSDASCWKIRRDNSHKPRPELCATGDTELEHKLEHVWPAILATIKNTTYEPNVLLTKVCEDTKKLSIKYSVTKTLNDASTLLQPVAEMTVPLYAHGHGKEYIAEIPNEDGPILLCITAPCVSIPFLPKLDYLDQLREKEELRKQEENL